MRASKRSFVKRAASWARATTSSLSWRFSGCKCGKHMIASADKSECFEEVDMRRHEGSRRSTALARRRSPFRGLRGACRVREVVLNKGLQPTRPAFAAWSSRWNAARRLCARSTQSPGRGYTAGERTKRASRLNPAPLGALMQLDELRNRIAQEPERHVEYPVFRSVESLDVKRTAGVLVTDFLANREPTGETRRATYRHVLGAPGSSEAIRAWQDKWPSHPLPVDLRQLVEQVNGVHLWADVETGRAYTGLAAIDEWQPARIAMYGPGSDPELLSERYLALSYHSDGSAFVVLDVDTGAYFLMDSCGPDDTCPLGSSVSELLDWLWSERLPPERGGA